MSKPRCKRCRDLGAIQRQNRLGTWYWERCRCEAGRRHGFGHPPEESEG